MNEEYMILSYLQYFYWFEKAFKMVRSQNLSIKLSMVIEMLCYIVTRNYWFDFNKF